MVLRCVVALLMGVWCVGASAENRLAANEHTAFIPLAEGKPFLYVIHEGRSVKIQRNQDPEYALQGYFAKTSRKCPPFCLQPMIPAPGVAAIGELELFEFMENNLRNGSGVLIDARTPSWFRKGTIPGSVNYPFTLFGKGTDSPEVTDLLEDLGATSKDEFGVVERLLDGLEFGDGAEKTEFWDFSAAKELVVWCNGPACQQSRRAIRGLLDSGYPSDRIKYYRGGMQMWQLWGLTTVVPGQ